MPAKTGIIVVSHSYQIGEGIKDLISQVMDDVPLAIAAGGEDKEIGTSLEKIQTSIEAVAGENGAVLFYDIGSAKMNAEIAIELSKKNVLLADGIPIVEGAYIAAVESNLGKSQSEIFQSLNKIKIHGFK